MANPKLAVSASDALGDADGIRIVAVLKRH